MNKSQKFVLLFIGFCMIMVIGVISFNVFMPKPEVTPDEIDVSKHSIKEEGVISGTDKTATKEYVNVFFIGKNSHGEEVYKAVKRQYDKDIDGSKFNFAIRALLTGPNSVEKSLGVYTEIPGTVAINKISETPSRIIIDLNSSFVNDGGTESLYKRLYQVIKTSRQNTNIPVYLYIDGRMADVLGGEGIMLSQPLSNSSLGN